MRFAEAKKGGDSRWTGNYHGSRLADAAAGGLIVLVGGTSRPGSAGAGSGVPGSSFCRSRAAMALPALGALPFAPRWSAGLTASPAAILPRADHEAPAETGSQPHPRGAAFSPVAFVPIEQPEAMTAGSARTGSAVTPGEPAESTPAARWRFPSAQTVLLASYFAVAFGMAAWWLVGQFLLWRVTRSARPVPEAVRAVLLGLAGPGSGRVVLLESDRIASPFTYTWCRPVILLPTSLCDGSEPTALRYVLAHEWSHVEGRDALVWNLACLAGLVLFYQPLFWWLEAPASPLPGLPG